jgi:metabotropic X receptor
LLIVVDSTASHLPLRITSMSVTISLSATVTLACLFSPKLYIIIFHPERNVRQVNPITKNCSPNFAPFPDVYTV